MRGVALCCRRTDESRHECKCVGLMVVSGDVL